MTSDNKFQVFLRVPRDQRSADEVAEDVLAILKKSPAKWNATFQSIQPKPTTRPTMAGWRWKREGIGLG